MTSEDVGQRIGFGWGSYSLGEAADAVWRVADAVGSSIEPAQVIVDLPRTQDELPGVELVVREPVDVRHLEHKVVGPIAGAGWSHTHPEYWSAEVNQTILTVRVDQEY